MRRILWIVIIIQLLIISAGAIWVIKSTKKTAYINITKVFSEFEMAKEYDAKLTGFINQTNIVLDSLKLHLNIMYKTLGQNKNPNKEKMELFSAKREEFLSKKEQFDESQKQQSDQYSSKVMGQLNQYVKEYGKQFGYTYIYGADGSGALMFANESEEITEDVINYINEKYNGKKK